MQNTLVKTQAATLTALSLRLLGWLLLLLPTLALAAALPTVSRVKDINTTLGSTGSDPQDIVKVGNITFFTAETPTTGRELWKSDGTAAGTVMVKDINPGIGSSISEYFDFTNIGTTLYFTANNGVNGEELWKSDGTAAGTVMVKDINAGTGSSFGYYSNLTAVGNVLYSSANNGVNGNELWKSDGTAAGTLLVKDINPGIGSSNPYYFTTIGTVLYFGANNGVTHYELWKSDGTAAGTVLVKDIKVGSNSSFCGNSVCYHPYFTAVGNVLYFFADNGVTGQELWRSDGTAAGTVLVKDICVGSRGSYPEELIAVGNVLYFTADNCVTGEELWKSDGTAAGTVLVKDINAGSGHSSPDYFTAVGNVLYFSAHDGVTGYELWKSDGTAAGTVLVKDIQDGSDSSNPDYFTAVGAVLYFTANNGINGEELWKSDGTAAGTVLVKDIYPGSNSSSPSYLTAMGNVLYFSANNGVTGYELWKSDGTAAGTVLVKDIYVVNHDSDPENLTAVGNVLYFTANNGVTGKELWKSNGTAAGTVLVKDINPGSGSAWVYFDSPNFIAVGNMLYFVANNGVTGQELWKSDGTAAGTVLVKDINPGSGSAFCYGYGYNCYDPSFTAVGNVVYFVADNGVTGKELWKSDGTTAGTVLVKDINPGNGSAWGNYDPYFTAVGTVLYFRASNGVTGSELWKSNGTAAETVLVKDINVGGSSYPYDLTALGNVLYFAASDGVHGSELWRSDGTAAGTVLVKDISISGIFHGSGNSLVAYPYFTAVGNVLYFRADNYANGSELWRSDGTAAGTVMVKDIYAGAASMSCDPYYDFPFFPSGDCFDPNFTAVGNMLYFHADNGINGKELWKSDGTEAGTLLVKDINPGSVSYWSDYDYPYFTVVGNMLYFVANNGVHGGELWQTDGSTAGTQMAADLVPGSRGSDPDYLTAIGSKLYFSAADDATGRELWRADIPNLLTVTPSANLGGLVTPNVPKAVASNVTLKFTVTPLPYYNRNPTVGGTCPPGSWSAGTINAPSVWTTGTITANCTVIFGFVSTLPDFVVTAITLNPLTPDRNGTFTATVTVKNQGPVAGDSKFLDVWSYQPVNQTCGAEGIQWQAVGTVAVGASKTFIFNNLYPRITGTNTFRAFVDSGCSTRESNEGNNQMTKAYTVR